MNKLYENIKENLKESQDMPYGFKDYDLEDIGYSEVNTHAQDLLKGVTEYFKKFIEIAEEDAFTFQGLEHPEYIRKAIQYMDEANKWIEKCWDDFE